MTGLFQAGEGIACAAAILGACGAGDFSFDHVLADVILAEVVVQGDVGSFEHEQQFGLVLVQALERLVQRLEVGLGLAQRIEALVDVAFGLGGGIELVGLELIVERPKRRARAV